MKTQPMKIHNGTSFYNYVFSLSAVCLFLAIFPFFMRGPYFIFGVGTKMDTIIRVYDPFYRKWESGKTATRNTTVKSERRECSFLLRPFCFRSLYLLLYNFFFRFSFYININKTIINQQFKFREIWLGSLVKSLHKKKVN